MGSPLLRKGEETDMDLHHNLDQLDRLNELTLVEGADWDVEIGTLTELSEERKGPALLFDRIKDYPPGYRVVSNLLSTPRRMAVAFGFNPGVPNIELVRSLKDTFEHLTPVAPVIVDNGPLLENVVDGQQIDLLRFPAPRWHEADGGRYLGTGDLVIMREPEKGWVNVGTYRVQLYDGNTLGLFISPSHQGNLIRHSYWKQGKSCPVAVVFGSHPLVWIPACTAFPWGTEEYGVAGGLLGRPLEVIAGDYTGLPIPAHGEIAIEGEIPPPEVESRQEGPFGEVTGYYGSDCRNEAVIKVKRLMFRNNPIILGCPPLKPPANPMATYMMRASNTWYELERLGIPGIKGVWNMRAGGSRYIDVISIEQKYAGHAKQVAVAAIAGVEGGQGRFVIVVDDDIDPSNDDDVLWAVATRCDPATSMEIVTGCRSAPIDPTIPPERKVKGDMTNSKALIMATRPYHWRKEFPAVNRASDELRLRTMGKWRGVFP